jgi:hypothetical protein
MSLTPEIRRLLKQWRSDAARFADDPNVPSAATMLTSMHADELEAALLASPADLPPTEAPSRYTKNDIGDMVCEHGTAADVHCCNCHSGFLFDIDSCECVLAAPSGPIGDLRAYGEAEATNALKAKDRDQYQFWQGWNAALQRVPAPALPSPVESPPPSQVQGSWSATDLRR